MAVSRPRHGPPGTLAWLAMARPFALTSTSRRPHLLLAVLACTALLVLFAGGWLAWQQGWLAGWLGRAEDRANTALLQVTSEPPGAAITVDGHERGRTPASLAVAPRRHTITLGGSEVIASRREVTVGADGASLAVALWAHQPHLTHLRPAYPGASIATAAFGRDGRLALVIALPSGGREAWLLDPTSGSLARIGPAGQWAALAVAPDGAQVAYLAASATTTTATAPSPAPGGSSPNSRLDEVWVAAAQRVAAPRLVFRLAAGGERLVDLSWSPDAEHLLLVTRKTLSLGGEQTRFLWLVLSGGEPRELLTLPGQVVPGSYTWEPNGHATAFLARPGTGAQTAVCVLEPETSGFRYLGDLVSDGSSSATAAAAPVTWDAAGTALYAVSAAPVVKEDTPLFGLRPMGGPRTTLALFRASSPAGTDDERLPGGDGVTGLAVRDDGAIVGLSRPKSAGPVVLRGIDPAGGQAEDLAELAVAPSPSGASLAARWDVEHAQVLLALPSGSLAATAPADYWLVRFAPAPSREAAP